MRKVFIFFLIFISVSCNVYNVKAIEVTAEWIDLYREKTAFPIVEDAHYYVHDGVLYYDNVLVAYPQKKQDVTYTIIQDTEYIADAAFHNNQYLETLIMPNSIVKIGSCAFEGSSSLSEVVLSDELLIISNSAFQNCDKLKEIELPSSLYAIGAQAFAETNNLTCLTIPAFVQYLGDEAFSLSAIEQITFEGYIEKVGICLFSPAEEFEINVTVPSDEYYYVEMLRQEYEYNPYIKITSH